MKISARVKPNSKNDRITKIDDTHFEIRVKARAQEGKANTAAIKVLAEYFKIPQSRIRLQTGVKSKQKVFEIL